MRRFVAIWFACSLLFLSATALFNFLVDPYWVFGTAKYTRLTHARPDAISQPSLAKGYLVARNSPSTLLIGSSRTDIGLNPESSSWPEEDRPVFNLGLPGSDMADRYAYLRYALSVSSPKLVIIELTFEDGFDPGIGQRTADSEFAASPQPGGAPPATWRQRLEDMVFALWSLSALNGSFDTLLGINDLHSAMTQSGFNTGGDLRSAAESDGYGYVVRVKDRSIMRMLINWGPRRKTDCASVARMIDLATSKGASVVVAILPGYVDELESFRQAGMLDSFNRWKQQLASTTDLFAARGKHVSLWNFSSYSPYTTEELPPPGDKKSRLHWFWETNHFKSDLGDLIIQRISKGAPNDLGTQLTAADIQRELAEETVRQTIFASTRPKDVERVRNIYGDELRQDCSENSNLCSDRTVFQN